MKPTGPEPVGVQLAPFERNGLGLFQPVEMLHVYVGQVQVFKRDQTQIWTVQTQTFGEKIRIQPGDEMLLAH